MGRHGRKNPLGQILAILAAGAVAEATGQRSGIGAGNGGQGSEEGEGGKQEFFEGHKSGYLN